MLYNSFPLRGLSFDLSSIVKWIIVVTFGFDGCFSCIKIEFSFSEMKKKNYKRFALFIR